MTADPFGQHAAAAAVQPIDTAIRPTIDVPASESFATADVARRCGIAARIDLVGGQVDHGSSAWYRLAYVDGGSRLQVFERYAVSSSPADPAMIGAQTTGWRVANEIVDPASRPRALPDWAHVHTGRDTGYSAGLMITLSYLDVLTPGPLAGGLRVAGSGGIGSDGVVMPVAGLDAKVAAAMLIHPQIVFTTSAPRGIRDVTVVESDHTRLAITGRTVAEQFNLNGFRHAGQDAASGHKAVAVVVVHDVRQALAYLCGHTARPATCTLADRAATLPIGTAA